MSSLFEQLISDLWLLIFSIGLQIVITSTQCFSASLSSLYYFSGFSDLMQCPLRSTIS